MQWIITNVHSLSLYVYSLEYLNRCLYMHFPLMHRNMFLAQLRGAVGVGDVDAIADHSWSV